ncbi:KRRI-Interacting protein 1 [Clonorchis sinensis]|uniref:Protein KRI1 homolog n=1 Tax=Clonorchis sinensis TaxID=79923 RepID=A0A8T1M0N5_CLOSI|nr:KRRI-Interacting protein 1 [Clonorchis sinensis]
MQFTINKEYAKAYNEFRKKEELQKLKDRHGDVKLSKKRKHLAEDMSKETDERSEEDGSTESSSDSDDDEEEEDDSSTEEREHEDFLRLYDALCRNDPSLDDPNKQWFHEEEDEANQSNGSAAEGPSNTVSSPAVGKTKHQRKSKDHRPVTLRDHERQFLLEHGGVEDEAVAADADRIAKLESDDVLNKLSHSQADASKAKFLEASEAALRQTEELSDNEDTCRKQSRQLGFLKRRNLPETDDHVKPSIDTENLRFTDGSGNSESEAFLRDFIVNQRWKRKQERRLPTYSEVLRNAAIDEKDDEDNVVGDESPSSIFSRLNDDNILDEDDDFLVRVRDFEREKQTSGATMLSLKTQVSKHRFEEEDKEFLKSYPRKITTSLHQSTTHEGRSARSMKREARRARKREQKQAKLAELARLRRLKLALLADKIERIKRTCGSGSDLLACDLDKLKEQAIVGENEAEVDIGKTALDLAEHLDEDWDPEKHDRLVERMFNDSYYQAGEDDAELPRFSDASDLESDHVFEDSTRVEDAQPSQKKRKKREQHASTSGLEPMYNDHPMEDDNCGGELDGEEEITDDAVTGKRVRRRLRGRARLRRALKRPKAPYDPAVDEDYEHYLDKHYKLTCEDVIPGPDPDEDLFCRFSYRQVTPNDYGLSTEEVLTATTGELNSWVPINRVTAYRTEEEEQRDLRVYHSNKKLEKKARVIASLCNPDAHWWPDDNASTSNKPSKKRKRSKKKRARDAAHAQLAETTEKPFADGSTFGPNESEYGSDVKRQKVRRSQKLKGVTISQSRLAACNITPKDVYRLMKRSKEKNSQNPTAF